MDAQIQKSVRDVYIPLPEPGPRLRIPHVASLSVINRHIAPITIPSDEIYKYVSSNLDFSEKYKDETENLGSAVKDVEDK